MKPTESNPIPGQNNENTKNPNPIPETKEQGKTTSDRMHIDPIEKKKFDTPNKGGKSGK